MTAQGIEYLLSLASLGQPARLGPLPASGESSPCPGRTQDIKVSNPWGY